MLRKSGLPLKQAGAFGYATSSDLAHWTWRGELYSPGDMAEPELPSMFKVGRQWYLLGFPNDGKCLGEPKYRMSPSCTGPWTVPVPDCLDGNHFCAGRTVVTGNGRLLFGWIPSGINSLGQQKWGGHFALPRLLYPLSDGRLAVRLEPSIAKRIRGEVCFPKLVPQAGNWRIDSGRAVASNKGQNGTMRLQSAPERIDLELDLTLHDDGVAAGVVLGKAQNAAGYRVVIDGKGQRLAVLNLDGSVRVQQATGKLQGRKVRFQVLSDGDIVEAFLDEQYALVARMPESLDGASVELFAQGAADFENIGLCRLLTLDEIQ
jgi:hypothetical protein